MSLRTRLVGGVMLLAAVGMVVVNGASLLGLWSYLVDVADGSLAHARNVALDRIGTEPGPLDEARLQSMVLDEFYVALFDEQGRLIAEKPANGVDGQPVPGPQLPTPVPPGFAEHAVTIPAHGVSDLRYRVLHFAVDGSAAVQQRPDTDAVAFHSVVAARSLRPTEDLLRWLLGAEVIATAAALGVIAVLGRGVLRVGLRPLRDMASTATAIAAGDVERRVDAGSRYCEIRDVGAALNRAFDARQRSEERLREFVADASHELRTPLTTIRGWAQLHLHGLAQDPQLMATAMSRIEGEASRMHVLAEELLLLARLDRGRPLASEPVDLGLLATDAVVDAGGLDATRPITIEVHGAVLVRGDEDSLVQVLRNLLDNAVRHTPPGTPVSVVARPLCDGEIELVVADQGSGMAADVAANIFERFYRGDRSRSPNSGGTGLGLSIVKSITEAHGGTVTVTTAPGRGATFTLTLPAAR